MLHQYLWSGKVLEKQQKESRSGTTKYKFRLSVRTNHYMGECFSTQNLFATDVSTNKKYILVVWAVLITQIVKTKLFPVNANTIVIE